MSFFSNLKTAISGALKGAAKNKAVVGSVLTVVLGAANYATLAPVATNIYCSALVKCDS